MKKIILVVLAALLLASALCMVGCFDTGVTEDEEETIFDFAEFDDGTCGIAGINRSLCADAEIVIPEESPNGYPVTDILSNAFENDTVLTSVVIPEGVTTIHSGAFRGCTSLASITLPETLTSIRENAFFGCSALASITFPDDLYEIGENAFHSCTALTSLTIPKGMLTIGECAFGSCSGLESLSVAEGNERYTCVDNCIMMGTGLILGCKNSVIPTDGSVGYIGNYAFSGAQLTSVAIPNGVESIGSCAFSGCTALTSVIIPDTVTGIDYAAFYGCESITTINLPGSLTSIGGLSLANCTALTDVYFDNDKSYWDYIVSWGGYPFENVTCIIHCNDGTIDITP